MNRQNDPTTGGTTSIRFQEFHNLQGWFSICVPQIEECKGKPTKRCEPTFDCSSNIIDNECGVRGTSSSKTKNGTHLTQTLVHRERNYKDPSVLPNKWTIVVFVLRSIPSRTSLPQLSRTDPSSLVRRWDRPSFSPTMLDCYHNVSSVRTILRSASSMT